MWSDTLYFAERQYLLRLLIWAAASLLAGAGLLVFVVVTRQRSPLLRQFAIQLNAWGVVEGACAAFAWQTVRLRDLAGAARLDRMVWFQAGFDTAAIAVGAGLAVGGWMVWRRRGVVGSGVGIALQGLALLVFNLQLAAIITR